MTWVSWVVMTVVVTATLVLLIHSTRMYRAYEAEDWVHFRAVSRQTMLLVGIWQIVMGVGMGVLNIDQDSNSWMPTITLVGSGVCILLLDWVRRKFEAVT